MDNSSYLPTPPTTEPTITPVVLWPLPPLPPSLLLLSIACWESPVADDWSLPCVSDEDWPLLSVFDCEGESLALFPPSVLLLWLLLSLDLLADGAGVGELLSELAAWEVWCWSPPLEVGDANWLSCEADGWFVGWLSLLLGVFEGCCWSPEAVFEGLLLLSPPPKIPPLPKTKSAFVVVESCNKIKIKNIQMMNEGNFMTMLYGK